MHDYVNSTTFFGLALIVGGLTLLSTALIGIDRHRRRRVAGRDRTRGPAQYLPYVCRELPPAIAGLPMIQRSVLLADTLRLDQVARR